ncbi:MAG: hypothetical protein HY600_06300, partial [Candidatus Omnitrophica bacterium]|nr:hypothetical protein [Candidatus Omnitrophota bacterium]
MTRFPALKSVAAITVAAFTVTTLLPAGWAWAAPARETMRVRQAEPDGATPSPVTTGLEEALGRRPTTAPSTAVDGPLQRRSPEPTIPSVVSSPAPPAFPKDARTVWGVRQASPPAPTTPAGIEEASRPSDMSRRTFLKTTAKAAAAVAAALPTVAALPPTVAPPPPTAAVAASAPEPLRLGDIKEMNVTWISPDGQVHGPVPRYVPAPPGLTHPRKFLGALSDEINTRLRQGVRAMGRRLGWPAAPPTVDDVKKWKPGRFGPVRAAIQSHPVWAPWLIDEAQWPALFAGARKAAGATSTARLYVDPYQAISPSRQWPANRLAAFMKQAGMAGVQVVFLLGDPAMAVYPEAARYLLRALVDIEALRPYFHDELHNNVLHIAWDIEPKELKELGDYNDPDLRKRRTARARYWANILQVVEGTQEFLRHEFQMMAQPNGASDGLEVTLFVPGDFAEEIEQAQLVVPAGTRLLVMGYHDDPRKVVKDVEAVVAAVTRDRGQPLEKQRFPRVTVGAAIETSPSPEGPAHTVFGPDAATLAATAGDMLGRRLTGNAVFNHEYFAHTATGWDLLLWLSQGGYTRRQLADRRLRFFVEKQASRHLLDAARFLTARALTQRHETFGTLPNGRPLNEKAIENRFRTLQRLASGMVGLPSAEAVWGMGWETFWRSLRRGGIQYAPREFVFNPDGLYVGPAIGLGGTVVLKAHAALLGDQGRIMEVERMFVNRAVPKARTRLPTGEWVEGQLVSHDFDILREADTRATQLMGNQDDVYWIVTVANPGSRRFVGFVRILLYTGYGEPIEVTSPPLTIPPFTTEPEESIRAVLRLRVGEDDFG